MNDEVKLDDNFKIRPFEREDFDEVSRLLTGAFFDKIGSLLDLDDPDVAGVMAETGFFYRKPVNGYLVVEVRERIAGVILLKFNGQNRESDDFRLLPVFMRYGLIKALKFAIGALLLEESTKPGECYIEYIATDSDFRGLGIGSALIDYAEYFAAEADLSWLSLCVSPSNRAINLYLRQGFIQKKEIKSLLTYLFFGLDKWIYMVKPIGKIL